MLTILTNILKSKEQGILIKSNIKMYGTSNYFRKFVNCNLEIRENKEQFEKHNTEIHIIAKLKKKLHK
jgi:hypothetical protein